MRVRTGPAANTGSCSGFGDLNCEEKASSSRLRAREVNGLTSRASRYARAVTSVESTRAARSTESHTDIDPEVACAAEEADGVSKKTSATIVEQTLIGRP